MSFRCFSICLLSAIGFTVNGGAEDRQTPEWIWMSGDRDGVSVAPFGKDFELVAGVRDATLRITADFARAEVSVNGEPVEGIEAFDPPAERDIRHLLRAGKNAIVIRAEGVEGPSAFAAEVSIILKNGESVRYQSDRLWLAEPGGALASFGRIHPHRWASNRLPEISAFAEYNQWREASGDANAKLSPLPPGFEIEVVHAATEDEGSWVSMVFDAKGRVLIGREDRGILRMTLPPNSGGEITVETINDTLEECRGLTWKDGDLYANANRLNGLYRLRDTDGDDPFDDVVLIRKTGGGTGHGRNDIALGPDGRIHAIHGDSVEVPDDARLKTASERGAPKELGHWVSTDGKEGDWIIHSRGLRNPYGIAFNPDGEAFTYDADNEGDVGLPIYRPTRINHLVSGANYGWHQDRGNTRNFPVYAPDTVPTTFDVGRGSPTAVKFGTRSHFPPPWSDALFALDWAYGRIVAVHLTPRGASYSASGEVFLEGRPLNVTDLDFDSTGALYFVTGGRKTQSALYRVRYTGPKITATTSTDQAKARAAFSAKARKFRRQLERYHGNPDPPDFEDAWEALGHPDPWIRNAARVGVETQDLERWRFRALNAKADLHGLTALLALVRAGTDEDRQQAARKVADFSTDGWNRLEKLTCLRIYETCEITTDSVDYQSIEKIAGQLIPWAEDPPEPIRRELVHVLAMMNASSAVSTGMRFLSEADDQFERLHYIEMLSEAGTGWSADQRRAYFTALAHAKRFSFGDRFMEGFFQQIEKNALSNLSRRDRTEFETLLAEGWPDDTEPAAVTARPFVRQWTLADFSETELAGGIGKRKLERGQELFSAVLCSRCHMLGTEGRPVGPDLTTAARRFSRRDLLEAIVEPSKVVAEVHRNVVIAKTDGSTVLGRIIQNDFRKSLLYVSTSAFLPRDLTEIPKSEIESYEESPISPMPPALLDTLTKEEILDLLAWIESGGRIE